MSVVKKKSNKFGGFLCGGVISETSHQKNIKRYGVWADTMSYIMPDKQYKKYIKYHKLGREKEVNELLRRFAISQI